MIAGFSVLSLALDAQTDIVTTQRIVSDIEIKKQQEEFTVFASTDANDILNLNINNQGQNPVEISSMWITNKTLSDQPATRYTINYDDAFIPTGLTSNILSTQTLAMIPDTYDIKVISSLGSIETIVFDNNGGGSSGLRAEMVTDPPDVIIGQNVTIAMIVTNTGANIVNNVHPDPLSFSATGSGVIIASSPHTPTYANLNSGASVMFTWDYQVFGDSGDELTFSSFATGDGVGNSNTVSDVSILREPTDGGSGSGVFDPDILKEGFLAQAELFFIIPSPQGESGDVEALWGINVVNPIDAPMEVSKLVLTAFAPGGNNNDVIFERTGGNCNLSPVSPNLGNDGAWSCPSENSLMWQNNTHPEIIPANSTKAFLIKVEPGKPSAATGLESILVQGSVFTTLGSFGKSGYQSTMSDTVAPIPNVFLSNSVGSRSSADITTDKTGLASDTVHTFHVALADMDLDDTTRIDSNAKLIINIPKGWKDVTVTAHPGFNSPTITVFGDTSTQIIGSTTGELGSSANPSDVITFTARSPSITDDRLYVMYVLAQGVTNAGFNIGPLAEIVLQVDG